MLATQPFVQHSSSLSLSPLPAFRTHFWIHSRLGLVFKVFLFISLFLSLYSYISYSNVTFLVCWTLLPGLQVAPVCWTLSPLQPPSAGLCRRFRAAFSALFGHWSPLAIGFVPPPHAVTGTPPSEGMALLILRTLRKVSPTCYWITVSASAYHMQSSKFLPWTCFLSC